MFMHTLTRLTLFSLILSSLTAASKSYHTPCSSLKEGHITLYIHGTTFPVISPLIGHHTERSGLYHYSHHTLLPRKKLSLGGYLDAADSKEFPAHSFYKYYWSGNLNFDARKTAANEIFEHLKGHKGPITIIAHSHGCNVALHLAQCAKEHKATLSIDRLILLAPPVQQVTASLVASDVFKRVYSLYSNADAIQVADPQHIYKESKKIKTDKKLPFFSERTFASAPQLSQAQVLHHYRSPSHRDFIQPHIFKYIPALIKIMDTEHKKENYSNVVNIPHQQGTPHLVARKKSFKRRGIDHCTCKNGRHIKCRV